MKKAFTLVEILIVITIISILSAITVGVLGNAKARAKTTVCASNQRQLATGLILYMQDHSDLMPVGSPFVTWSEPI
ncbi:MAG: prepilin-type N-terminal cleavage/methylation domain-containing protein, partial [Fimbriimonadaceae bacterium]